MNLTEGSTPRRFRGLVRGAIPRGKASDDGREGACTGEREWITMADLEEFDSSVTVSNPNTILKFAQFDTPRPPAEVTYRFPDGRAVELKDERWLTPEALFNPELVISRYHAGR